MLRRASSGWTYGTSSSEQTVCNLASFPGLAVFVACSMKFVLLGCTGIPALCLLHGFTVRVYCTCWTCFKLFQLCPICLCVMAILSIRYLMMQYQLLLINMSGRIPYSPQLAKSWGVFIQLVYIGISFVWLMHGIVYWLPYCH